MENRNDWQISCDTPTERCAYIYELGHLTDCNFVVESESGEQITFKCHKLILAMTSPVFETMFYGQMAETRELIHIDDTTPNTFIALLDYIYKNDPNIKTFNEGRNLLYLAMKYIIPDLINKCTDAVVKFLTPEKVFQAYEFGTLYALPSIVDKALELMRTRTLEVLPFLNSQVNISTVIQLFDQQKLVISSELDLFKALEKYHTDCMKYGKGIKRMKDYKAIKDSETTEETQEMTKENNVNEITTLKTNQENCENSQSGYDRPIIRDALKKIRFFTLSSEQFAADTISTSRLLNESEIYAIVMNLSNNNSKIPWPAGFSQSTASRR